MILHHLVVNPVTEPRGTIIAIPGLAESAAATADALARWAADGWKAIALDPRGHGESPRWNPELLQRHPGDVIVEDLTADFDELHVPSPIVLYGHSAGGAAAAALALARADQVAALVLEDPFWRLPVTRHQDPAVAREATERIDRQQHTSIEDLVAEQRAAEPQWPVDEYREWAIAKHQVDREIIRNGDVIPSQGWPDILADLQGRVPVLVLTGTDCIGITPEHQHLIEERGGTVVRFDGASHFVRRDRRDELHQVMAAFLHDRAHS